MINSGFSELYQTDHLFRAAIDTLARLCLEAYERDLLNETEAAPLQGRFDEGDSAIQGHRPVVQVGESECEIVPSITSIASLSESVRT